MHVRFLIPVVAAFLVAAQAHAAQQEQADYLKPGQLDLTQLLPPPPARGSQAEKRDIDALLRLQRERTPAQADRAKADGEVSVWRFNDVLGASFAKEKLPRLDAFFARVRHTESAFVSAAKNYWARPRPFEIEPRLHAIPELQKGVLNDDGRTYNHAYPGGHATFGATCAIVLSQMVPEKRAERTTEGGLDVGAARSALGPAVKTLQSGGIEVSLFIDPRKEAVRAAAELGARRIELHTGDYCNATTIDKRRVELERIAAAAEEGVALGLHVAAGHGLDYPNVGPVAATPGIVELNIGHAVVARAVLVGLDRAVRDMIAVVREQRPL